MTETLFLKFDSWDFSDRTLNIYNDHDSSQKHTSSPNVHNLRFTSTPFSCTNPRNIIEFTELSRFEENRSFITDKRESVFSLATSKKIIFFISEVICIVCDKFGFQRKWPCLFEPSCSSSTSCLLFMLLAADNSALVWKNFSLLKVPNWNDRTAIFQTRWRGTGFIKDEIAHS